MDEMTYKEYQGILEDQEDDHALQMDGYDNCVIGAGEIAGSIVLIYDESLIIQELMNQGMDHEEAWEWYSFNQAGAFVGSGTPVIQTVKIIPESNK